VSREQDILAAAERLFFERSYDGVGVDDIGRAAGVSGSAIYRHFSGKEEILAALFDKAIDGMLMYVAEPDPDPSTDLRNLLKAFLEFNNRFSRNAAIWIREQGTLSEQYRRGHDRRQQRFMDRWVTALTRCYPDRSRDELTTAARAVQLLLMSEALRRPGGRRAKNTDEILLDMAFLSLGALQPATTRAAG
jgi:AcrR family transcriptional regulator